MFKGSAFFAAPEILKNHLFNEKSALLCPIFLLDSCVSSLFLLIQGDIYSFGMVLYFIFTGKDPFSEGDDADLEVNQVIEKVRLVFEYSAISSLDCHASTSSSLK